MPKVLIIESCLVNHGGDAGGEHTGAGEVLEVSKQNATDLVGANRALYVDKKEDPSKGGINTASDAMLKAAKAATKADKKSAYTGEPSGAADPDGSLL